jgi:hypothetical protein
MAIRQVKIGSLIDYKERQAIQERTGKRIEYARVRLDEQGEPALYMHSENQEHLGFYYTESDVTSHEGRVVAIETDANVRIMSDVWANITYAVVYEPNGPEGVGSERVLENHREGYGMLPGLFRRIEIGNTEFPIDREPIHVKVDATPEVQEIWEAYKAGEALRGRMSRYDADERAAAERRRTVERDCFVRVTRGRKVPQGTEGKVFWIGDSQWGTKVGIGLPSEDGTFETVKKTGRHGKVYESYKNVVWTALKNVDRISCIGGRVL